MPSPAKEDEHRVHCRLDYCAYGVEASGVQRALTTTKQNSRKSCAYFASQELGADYSAVCYSSYGVVSGRSPNGTQNNEMLFSPLYDVVAEGYGQPWVFSVHD